MNKFEQSTLWGTPMPTALSDQEKRQRARTRSALEATFPKCRCGSTARKGFTTCSRCGDEDFESELAVSRVQEAHEALEKTLYEAGLTDYSLVASAISELIDAKIKAR